MQLEHLLHCICLIFTATVKVDAQNCEDSTRSCDAFFQRYHLFGFYAPVSLPRVSDAAALTSKCNEWEQTVGKCWSHKTCSQPIQHMSKGVTEFWKYLCGTGYQEYSRHTACLTTGASLTGALNCVKKYYTTKDIYPQVEEDVKEFVCASIRQLVTCITESVREHCGDNAASITEKLNAKLIDPPVSELCFPTAIVLYTAIPLVVIVVLVLFMALCCRIKKEKRSVGDDRSYTSDQDDTRSRYQDNVSNYGNQDPNQRPQPLAYGNQVNNVNQPISPLPYGHPSGNHAYPPPISNAKHPFQY